MKKTIKCFYAVMLAAAIAATVSGCGSGKPQENEEKQLAVWGTYASAKVMQDPALNGNNAHFAPNL